MFVRRRRKERSETVKLFGRFPLDYQSKQIKSLPCDLCRIEFTVPSDRVVESNL